MNAEEARAATAPGGPLEFVHAGGRIIVPVSSSTVEDQLRGAIFTAVVNDRPTLFDGPEGREAVLISRARYNRLLQAEAQTILVAAMTTSMVATGARRLRELDASHGCEATAEKAEVRGRFEAAGEIAAVVEVRES